MSEEAIERGLLLVFSKEILDDQKPCSLYVASWASVMCICCYLSA